MKICLINNLYGELARGGTEKIVKLIHDELVRDGHDVFIISTKPRFTGVGNSTERIYYLNSFYYFLNKVPLVLRFFWHLWDMLDIFSYFKIKKIMRKEKVDVVLSHNLKGIGFLSPLAIKNLRIKHIHFLHDIQLLHPSGLMYFKKENILNSVFAKFYQKLCAFLFGFVSMVISPSNWLLNNHLDRGFFKKSKNIVLSNPAVIPRNVSTRITHGINLLYVGQIEEHKGILFLVKSLVNFGDDFNFVIAGSGSQEAELKKIIKNNNKIKFVGKRSGDEIIELMSNSSLLVIPSTCYENSPMVIYEAAVMGLPVLASRLGGIKELVDCFGGILFNPGDSIDLIKKIKWATSNPLELDKIRKIELDRIGDYDINKYIKKLTNIMKSI